MEARAFSEWTPVGPLRVIPRLLRPKLLGALGRNAGRRTLGGKVPVLLLSAAGAFAFLFFVSTKLLRALRDVPEVGPLLASKMLGLGLLLFLSILLLSNLIAALSSYFLAKDLPSIVGAPVDWLGLYGGRLIETLGSSSWMVVLMLLPVVAAYQWVYQGDAVFYGIAAAAIIPYLVIPAVVGSAITLVLVRVVPARRTRDILALVSVVAVALLIVGIRVLRPERLMNPEGFRNLVDFLEVLRTPSSPWLPSRRSSAIWRGASTRSGSSYSGAPRPGWWSAGRGCTVDSTHAGTRRHRRVPSPRRAGRASGGSSASRSDHWGSSGAR
jgi:ABC-2 type transport system permease protein